MKSITYLITVFAIIFVYASQKSLSAQEKSDKSIDPKQNTVNMQKMEESLKSLVNNIQWFGQASVKITSENKVVYIDPYNLKNKDAADFIFITHSHSDHLSIEDIKKIVTENTKIFAPKDCIDQLKSADLSGLSEVEIGKSFSVDEINVDVVPAYNIKKTDFHPQGNHWVGYVLEIEGVRIYHPGDTERIPEMKNIDCDIAFMCLGQTYTMNSVEDAVQSVLDVKAEVAIPFHYGMYEGAKEDALKFKELLAEKVKVVLKSY